MKEDLRGFQKRFIRGALAPGIDVAALSIPRGNGVFSSRSPPTAGFDPWGCSARPGRGVLALRGFD